MANRLTDECLLSKWFCWPGNQNLEKNREWRLVVENDCGLIPIPRVGSNNYSKDVKIIQDSFCEYFNSNEVQSSWQRDMAFTLLTPKD